MVPLLHRRGGATRYIESDGQGNNHLVIDSYSNWHVSDYADYYRQMDPDGPNERFFCEWRVLISATHANADHGLTIAADDMHMINYGYLMNAIWDGFDGWTAPITPGVFHAYRIESADMVSYRLYIDGSLARVASWFEGLAHGYAGFGDEALGGQTGSTSSWDYFRFGVYEVPEPFSALLIVGMCVCGGRRRV